MPFRQQAALFALIFAVLLALHAPLLSLPYFWDEAGHYIPAARDLMLRGDVIPASTISNAHPPLPMFYLAAAWKVTFYSPVVTRIAMLLCAALASLQVYLLAWKWSDHIIATWTAALTALYPIVFAQSTLAHADLPAFAFSLWGIRKYSDGSLAAAVALFTLATLSKETTIIVPASLAALVMIDVVTGKNRSAQALRAIALLALPLLVLCLWFGYHYFRTGFIFGNPEFFRYNVATTFEPARILLALFQRIWHSFGHMNLWVLTAIAAAGMLLPARSPQLPPNLLRWCAAIAAGHILLFSLVGGALLTRYLLPVYPLVIFALVFEVRRRIPRASLALSAVAIAFVVGWFVNPPFRFAPEDNLNYSDYVRLHQRAAQHIEKDLPRATILTAWPASDELTKPYLHYVGQPMKTVRIEDFSLDQILLAKQAQNFDAAFVFSTKYEPARNLALPFWQRANERFFHHRRDLPPEAIAGLLGGQIVYQEKKNGQWVAVIVFDRIRLARSF